MHHDAQTALREAVAQGNIAEVRVLVKQPNINLDQDRVLLPAAMQESPEILACLLDAGADIDIQDSNGLTALTLACGATGETRLHSAMLLIDRGANVDLEVVNGFTPLLYASQRGALGLVSTLLKKGANPNSCAEAVQGVTPLLLAADGGHEEVALTLLEHGADNTVATSDGFTTLMYGARNGLKALTMALTEGPNAVERIVINASNNSGFTALHFAIVKRQLDVADILLRNGADPNAQDANERPPLMAAVAKKDIHGAFLLLRYGANPNLVFNGDGLPLPQITPVSVALFSEEHDIIRLLQAYGGDLDLALGKKPRRHILDSIEKEMLISSPDTRAAHLAKMLPEILSNSVATIDAGAMNFVEACLQAAQEGKLPTLNEAREFFKKTFEVLETLGLGDQVADYYLTLIY